MKKVIESFGPNGRFSAEISVSASSFGNALGSVIAENGKVTGYPETLRPDRLIETRVYSIAATVNNNNLFQIHSVHKDVLKTLLLGVEFDVQAYIDDLANTAIPENMTELQLMSLGYFN